MSFCSNCGQQMRDDAGFCPNCGKSKKTQQTPSQPVRPYSPVQYPPVVPSPPRRTSNVPLVLVVIVVVIVAILLVAAFIPVTAKNGPSTNESDSTNDTVDTSNTFFNRSSGSMTVEASDLGSGWTNATIVPDYPLTLDDNLWDTYTVTFNKSSNGGWLEVTFTLDRYKTIPEANKYFSFHSSTASSYLGATDLGVGDGSFFWSADEQYRLTFIKGNMIVHVGVDNNTPYYIDGETIIKELANVQAGEISN